MSNAGKFVMAFFALIALAVTGGSFLLFGQEIALRVGTLSLAFLALLIVAKVAGNKDFYVYVIIVILGGYFALSIVSGNYGSRLVDREMTGASYIIIDSEIFTMRGNEFGSYPNNSFVAQGTITSNRLTFNGQTFEVTGFFESWPIIATGNGQKLTISFSK